jgi:hypothetical protein
VDQNAKYERARKRVEELKGFYGHLLAYIVINVFLLVVNYLTSPGHYWFQWPLFGWGIGLAIHAATVFFPSMFWGHDWEERKIRELVEKDRGE